MFSFIHSFCGCQHAYVSDLRGKRLRVQMNDTYEKLEIVHQANRIEKKKKKKNKIQSTTQNIRMECAATEHMYIYLYAGFNSNSKASIHMHIYRK